MIHVILDGGHGINTPGKRSFYKDNKGKTLLRENEFNDSIVAKVGYGLSLAKIKYSLTSPEYYDTSLSVRVMRANSYFKSFDNTIFLSIHADAFRLHTANGATIFYKGHKELAELFDNIVISNLGIRNRGIKKANFKVLRATKSPALLFECGFMTNWGDLSKLLSEEYRNKVASKIIDFFVYLDEQ